MPYRINPEPTVRIKKKSYFLDAALALLFFLWSAIVGICGYMVGISEIKPTPVIAGIPLEDINLDVCKNYKDSLNLCQIKLNDPLTYGFCYEHINFTDQGEALPE